MKKIKLTIKLYVGNFYKIRTLIRKRLKRKFVTKKNCRGSLKFVFKNTTIGSLDLDKFFELKSYGTNLQKYNCKKKEFLKIK